MPHREPMFAPERTNGTARGDQVGVASKERPCAPLTMPGTLRPVKLAERIRQIREAKGLSQSECAETAGLTRHVWHDHESARERRANPKLSTVFALARGLGVTPSELLAGVDEEP
jgi:DNA-binding XRE family transcriptional regulator